MAFLKEILPIAAGIAAGALTGGASVPLSMAAGAAASAGTTGLQGGDTNEMLISGAGGALGGMGGGAMAANGTANAATAGATELGAPVVDSALAGGTDLAAQQAALSRGGLESAQLAAQDQAMNQVGAQTANDAAMQEMMVQDQGLGAANTEAFRQPADQTWRGATGATTPPAETGNWIGNNQGKSLMGLGAASMGLNEYHMDKEEQRRKDNEKEGEQDWRGRVDWYGSQDGPVNSMTDYERRNG